MVAIASLLLLYCILMRVLLMKNFADGIGATIGHNSAGKAGLTHRLSNFEHAVA